MVVAAGRSSRCAPTSTVDVERRPKTPTEVAVPTAAQHAPLSPSSSASSTSPLISRGALDEAHSMAGKQRTPFESPFMVVLWALTFVVVEGIAIQAGGQVASWVFGGHRVVFGPIGSGAGIFGRLVHHLGDPKAAWNLPARAALPGPVALWASLLLTHLVVLGLVVVVVRAVRRLGEAIRGPSGAPAKASRSQIERRLGRRAVERHTVALYGKGAVALREPLALGIDVATGARLFAKSEDYILAVGVPRVGKGEGFVIPAILRHKGPAVVTATRHDTYMDTAGVRARSGPVYVFDPQGPRAGGREAALESGQGMRDAPRRPSCVPGDSPASPGSARRSTVAGRTGSRWRHRSSAPTSTLPLSRAWASKNSSAWSRRPAAREPVRILSRHSDAARGWDEDLATSAEVEPRHRDSIWATVRRAFDCFADPMVLEATRVDARHLRPCDFLDQQRDDLSDGLTERPALSRPDRRRPDRRGRRHGTSPGRSVSDAPARVALGAHAGRVRQHRPAW